MSRRTARDEPDFWQYARDFLHDYCPKTRHMSATTIRTYHIGLEAFISYLTDNGTKRQDITFDAFNKTSVKDYSTWMSQTKGYAPRTIDLRLTVLKSFLKYAAWQDASLMALHNGLHLVKPPKASKQPIEHLSPQATTAILAAWGTDTPKARRNRALLILLYDSAARVSEITNTTLGDLHLGTPPFITLTGKGTKTRHMPLMDKTTQHLRAYLEEFHNNPISRTNPSTPLFYSLKHGQPAALSTDTISTILTQAATRARPTCPQIPDRVHPHLLRKTRAMDLYTDGIPLPLIMQMLGHESMTTTSTFYAFATMQMMTDAIAGANPQAIGEAPTWRQPAIIDALYHL